MREKTREVKYKTEVKLLQKQIKNLTELLIKNGGFLNRDFINISDNADVNNSIHRKQNDLSFETLITGDKQRFFLQLLEDFGLTTNGISCMSERKKGALRGVVESCREHHILPLLSLEVLCKTIASKIQLDLSSKLNYSSISDYFKRKTDNYIKANLNK